jgi:uncharacterized protein (TIGR03435 family)
LRAQGAFEVASIKLSADPPGRSGITTRTGRMLGENVTLKRCIIGAYNVTSAQVSGGPAWIDEDRYYIEAKASTPADDPGLMAMLQTLLAERFKLALHRETRSISGYALVAVKLKLKASEAGAPASTQTRRGGIDAKACTMARLAAKLSEALRVPVVDATGISGGFDVMLEWTADEMSAKSAADSGPSLFTAVQEQLGLKLVSRKIAAEVLVIDHAEKPVVE